MNIKFEIQLNCVKVLVSIIVKAAWRGYLKNIWHISNIYK